MGKAEAIRQTPSEQNPHSGHKSLKVEFSDSNNWGGVVWQSPANDWGDQPGGWNLSGAKTLSFWARGESGGEEVSFSFGLLDAGKNFPDSSKGETGKIKLSAQWQKFSIDLAGKDLSRIKTGFCWVIAGQGKPVTFYLDDIRYE